MTHYEVLRLVARIKKIDSRYVSMRGYDWNDLVRKIAKHTALTGRTRYWTLIDGWPVDLER